MLCSAALSALLYSESITLIDRTRAMHRMDRIASGSAIGNATGRPAQLSQSTAHCQLPHPSIDTLAAATRAIHHGGRCGSQARFPNAKVNPNTHLYPPRRRQGHESLGPCSVSQARSQMGGTSLLSPVMASN